MLRNSLYRKKNPSWKILFEKKITYRNIESNETTRNQNYRVDDVRENDYGQIDSSSSSSSS